MNVDVGFLPTNGRGVGTVEVEAGQVLEGIMTTLSGASLIPGAGWWHQRIEGGSQRFPANRGQLTFEESQPGESVAQADAPALVIGQGFVEGSRPIDSLAPVF